MTATIVESIEHLDFAGVLPCDMDECHERPAEAAPAVVVARAEPECGCHETVPLCAHHHLVARDMAATHQPMKCLTHPRSGWCMHIVTFGPLP